jgi:DnaJ-class molecular chaperone
MERNDGRKKETIMKKCPECKGKGYIEASGTENAVIKIRCPRCDGKKKI